MNVLARWLILSGTVYGLAYFMNDISVTPWWTIFVVGACLVFIIMVVEPILKILTFPITLITLGLFSIVLNALLFWFLGYIVPGFVVATFLAAFYGSLIVWIIDWIGSKMFK